MQEVQKAILEEKDKLLYDTIEKRNQIIDPTFIKEVEDKKNELVIIGEDI